jgi:hypothetical protein
MRRVGALRAMVLVRVGVVGPEARTLGADSLIPFGEVLKPEAVD